VSGGRRERAVDALRATGADVLLAADPATVGWLTGYVADIETGPSPFAIGPFALLQHDGSVVLVASEDAGEALPGVSAVWFAGYGLGPLDPLDAARDALAPLLAGRRVAVEAHAVPAGLLEDADWVDAGAPLRTARAIKDPDELDALRAAIALCDAGQRAVRDALAPGVTELELWTAARAAMELAAGGRLAVLADLVSGPRTAEIGGPPTERAVAEGDLVLCDLVPRHRGVWGDSCATLAVGPPPAEAVVAHRRCVEALDAAIERLRPGVRAGAIDATVRDRLGAELPHHVGHGLGWAYHEHPRIVPGATDVLEEGMVVAIEPGRYAAGCGVRVERVAAITADGCEVLSGHDLSLTA